LKAISPRLEGDRHGSSSPLVAIGDGAATLGLDGSSQLTSLTMNFHDPGFVATLNSETTFRQEKGFRFQLSDEDKQKAKSPFNRTNILRRGIYGHITYNKPHYRFILSRFWINRTSSSDKT
jgi:hypothetical protein